MYFFMDFGFLLDFGDSEGGRLGFQGSGAVIFYGFYLVINRVSVGKAPRDSRYNAGDVQGYLVVEARVPSAVLSKVYFVFDDRAGSISSCTCNPFRTGVPILGTIH